MHITFTLGIYVTPISKCNQHWLAKLVEPNAVYLKRAEVHRADLPLYTGFGRAELLTWIEDNVLQKYIPELGTHCNSYDRGFLADVNFIVSKKLPNIYTANFYK